MAKVFALVDANNYYVSCERLFNPKLRGVPTVVCGNLDRWGCIISRSQEAKDLGIKMAVPAFQVEDIIKKNNVQVCASNYTLYADIHSRMAATVNAFTPIVDDYSIDEFFLNLTGCIHGDMKEYGQKIRKAIWNVGVPTTVGIAPTKLLAKVATEIGKINKSGVEVLMDERQIDQILLDWPLDELWGIGSKLNKRLWKLGIRTALQLKQADDDMLLRKFGIVMLRMADELRGHSCIELDAVTNKAHKQYMCSRSFGKYVETYEEVAKSVGTFATRAAERMRGQGQLAQKLMVFVMTNHFRHDQKQYRNSCHVKLPSATSDSGRLIAAANEGLRHIFKEGYKYKKAGVILTEISDYKEYQTDLFSFEDKSETKRLMRTVDDINYRHGQDTVFYGSTGRQDGSWGQKRIMYSKHYTTNWNDLLRVS